MEILKKNQQVIKTYMFISVILGVLFLIFSLMSGWLRLSKNEITIESFYICKVEDGEPKEIQSPITPDSNLTVCGYIRTKYPISFNLYVYHTSSTTPILTIDMDNIEQGFFYQQLHLSEGSVTGEYSIYLHLRRQTLATTKFIVVE